jgi:predicted ester cyclase
VSAETLARLYRDYIACLNRQDWTELGRFVHRQVTHNERLLGLEGYRQMLVDDYAAIPDLRFTVDWLVSEPPFVAARLAFTCTPKGRFLDLPVHGRTISFAEHVFYRWEEDRIVEVRSILDKAAVERQL